MNPDLYDHLRNRVCAEYQKDIDWSESVHPPKYTHDLAFEAGFVIVNSGMKWTVAQGIWCRVRSQLRDNLPVSEVFGHSGKCSAIEHIWKNKGFLYAQFLEAYEEGPEAAVEWCQTLPWIGPITKYHLAKNLGVDCAKPDRHLERVADHYGTDTHALCKQLSKVSGDRVATVDYVIWRACERGWFCEDQS